MSQRRITRKPLKNQAFHDEFAFDASRRRIDNQRQFIALEKRTRRKTKSRSALGRPAFAVHASGA